MSTIKIGNFQEIVESIHVDREGNITIEVCIEDIDDIVEMLVKMKEE